MKSLNPLLPYVIGVILAMGVAITIVYFVRGAASVRLLLIFFGGFLLGMLSLYIKMRLLGR